MASKKGVVPPQLRRFLFQRGSSPAPRRRVVPGSPAIRRGNVRRPISRNRRPLRKPVLRRQPIRRPRNIVTGNDFAVEREINFLDVPDATNPNSIVGSNNIGRDLGSDEDFRGPPEEVDPNGFGLDAPRFRRS